MSKTIIAVADSVFPSLDPAKEALKDLNPELRMSKDGSVEEILKVAKDCDALLVTYAKITADVINGMEKCKSIGRFGIGVDNIDIDAATKAGIVVNYVPDYCIDEVSDHAMAMLLALARKITFSDKIVQQGRWEMPAVVPLARLRGRTMGLAGFGKIPQCIVPKAQAFGMDVITYDPYVSEDVLKKLNVKSVGFDELLAQSDYISVHAPLTPETENLFNAQAFKKMKNNALLINTARGPLVNDADLAAALDAGEIGGAGLDVVPVEPLPKDSPLLGRDNLILSPHTGFYSEDALLELQTKAASDVASVLKGEKPVYPVNPEALK
ncbi:MAG: C-terminal binding protein [Rhodospirillaceae bacterium]|jgi:D-3-phosphoglycerate dehydrogenase